MVPPLRAESPLRLTVRIYNSAGVSPGVVASAQVTARPILADTGLDVAFRFCGTRAGDDPVDPCDDPLNASEVVVRLIDGPLMSTTVDRNAFGVSYVDRDTDTGWLATVFADRIAPAAARAGIEHGTLMGLVVAHEVGHLLLGQRYHGDSGVMRAEWPDSVLAAAAPRTWRFSVAETAAIQRRILYR